MKHLILTRGLTLMLICLFIDTLCFSQAGDDEQYKLSKMPVFVPTSPNAANLARLAEIQANGYSGGVNVSIPIYSIPLKNLQVPVSLSYSGSGIKVNEYSPSTGMGWSLSAGGVITRIVRGKPDDQTDGYLDEVPFRSQMMPIGKIIDLYVRDSLTSGEKLEIERAVAEGGMDGQPDLYSYSFPGQSGIFFITPVGRIIPIPYTPIKISGNSLNGFIITDTRGNQFKFTNTESTFSYSSVVNTDAGTSTSPIDPDVTRNSWYLSRIITPQREEVVFDYKTDTISPVYQASETAYYLAEPTFPTACGAASPFKTSYSITSSTTQSIGQLKLKSILFPTGKLSLNYLQARTDLTGDSALTEIAMENLESTVVKKFKLNYTYYSSRLFLTKVQEFNGNDSIPPYLLDYHSPSALPNRTSKAQDYWGFFNNQTSNSSLIPEEVNNFGSYFIFFPDVFGDANREPDSVAMKYGAIQRITYPTGGYTIFDFEPHRYSKIKDVPVSDTTFITSSHMVNTFGNTVGTPVYSDTITIDYKQSVQMGYSIYGNATSVKLVKLTGSSEVDVYSVFGNNTAPKNGGTFIMLEAGNYKLRSFNYEEEFYANISMTYKTRNGYNVKREKIGGGIRLKKTSEYNATNQVVKKKFYYYKLNLSDTVSSGTLIDNPTYSYFTKNVKTVQCGVDDGHSSTYPGEIVGNYYVKMSNPTVQLGASGGSYVSYNAVIVLDDSLTHNGYSIQKFRSIDTASDQYFSGFPFTERIAKEYRRNQTINEKKFENGFGLRSEFSTSYLDNNYVITHSADWMAPGLNVGYVEKHPIYPSFDVFASKTYYIFSGYVAPQRITTKLLGASASDSLKTQKDIFYENNNHLFPTRIETTQSNSSKEIKYSLYPPDYAKSSFISAMIDSNIIDAPVEEILLSEEGGVKTIIGGKNAKYNLSFPYLIDSLFVLKTAAPIPLNQFKFSNNSTGNLPFPIVTLNSFSKDSKMIADFMVNSIDSKGNVLTQMTANNITQSTIWDYQQNIPIATCNNADNTSIGYTSFEADSKGNWSFTGTPATDTTAPTGKKAFTIVNSANNITKNGLSTTTTYIVTYWKKSGTVDVNGTTAVSGKTINGWTYYKHTVANPSSGLITVSGTSGVIDELRLYPVGAQMTTYTYDPLIGISSQCDANNRITYYKYDVLGRLKTILDQDRKVLKTYDYQYQVNNNQ